MKIAIDASRAINEKAGIGRYTLQLVKKMIAIDKKNDYLLLFTYFRKNPEKEKIIKSFERPNVKIVKLRLPGGWKEKIWHWQMPLLQPLIRGAQVFFAPSFFETNFGLKIPQVVTIHDLATFIFPDQRGQKVSDRLSKRAYESAKLAKKIIVPSFSTAKDAQKFLKIRPEKIAVIYPGKTEFGEPVKKLPSKLRAKSFILFVGTIEPRKNLIGLFKAYALLPPKLQSQYPLVVVGVKGWNTGETFEVLKTLKLTEKVKFLGFASDSLLARLYKEAAVFVYPSLYEGFGLPVLEALIFGVPVVTANTSSLTEVAGKAAALIDPEDPKSIAKALQRLLEAKFERELLKKEAVGQVKKFSWEKAAKETIKVCQEVARG